MAKDTAFVQRGRWPYKLQGPKREINYYCIQMFNEQNSNKTKQ